MQKAIPVCRHICRNLLILSLAVIALQAQTAPPREGQDPAPKATIIIDRQLVRFTTPEAHEWRLEITNQQGEVVFDSGFVQSAALEWPLLNQQGEAVGSGLYAYALSFHRDGAEHSKPQRGHIILNRAGMRLIKSG